VVIPRETTLDPRRRRIVAAIFALAALAVTVGVARLEPAAPSIERAAVWTATRCGAERCSVRLEFITASMRAQLDSQHSQHSQHSQFARLRGIVEFHREQVEALTVRVVEILDGLVESDVVILSDMSAFDPAERVRIR
jgi:hypothetical protein